ncbi:hypothetical protein NEIELOOT_02783 [Neisseria elongata subsp. glycolytica ATCC 29315]|uniref:Uncharacterized protein n=1 Tax=Neisseria elongata subsp. glycolytica ATCC 29315 TaxID=546263 RepID=D4DUI8_NEIEG|nr:hypothetical protein NEIELOOT_02783 [Neisseria elongata subsp. glycolytica ATCC 29315]
MIAPSFSDGLRPSENAISKPFPKIRLQTYSGLNLNQDKATKPQTVQIVRQGEATPYWFKFNPLYQTIKKGESNSWN